MKQHLSLTPYTLITALVLNTLFIGSGALGAVLMAAYVVVFGVLTGRLISRKETLFVQWFLGILALLVAYCITLTALFYLFDLSLRTQLFTFIIISLMTAITAPAQPLALPKFKIANELTLYLLTIFTISALATLVLLYLHTSAGLIKTPWELFTTPLTGALVATLVSGIWLTVRTRTSLLAAAPVGVMIFIALNIANILYTLGFGYDGFIHRATEQLLFETGTIHPKPLYYIGQYGLVTFFAHLTQLPLALFDRFLTSLIAAIFIPATAWLVGTRTDVQKWPLYVLGFFTLPFSLLINPTPQATSLVLVILLVILSLGKKELPFITEGLLGGIALAATAIHPLSGIPAVLYAGWIILGNHQFKFRAVVNGAWLLASACALVAAFFVANGITPSSVTIQLHADLTALKSLFIPGYLQNFIITHELAYWYGVLARPLFMILGIWGAIIGTKTYRTLALFSALTAVNAALLFFTVSFTNLPASESYLYVDRIITVALILLTPCAIYPLTRISLTTQYAKVFAGALCALVLGSSLYLSYPRFDNYQANNLRNTTFDDLVAVQQLEKHAYATPYVVLASQMTSAAAVKEFGFDRTITTPAGEKTYYYPIPTGGRLHALYQELLASTSPEIVTAEVKKYTGVSTVYLLLPDWWSNYPALDAKFKSSALLWRPLTPHTTLYQF